MQGSRDEVQAGAELKPGLGEDAVWLCRWATRNFATQKHGRRKWLRTLFFNFYDGGNMFLRNVGAQT